MKDHVQTHRWGVAWCATCDTRWSLCRARQVRAEPPPACREIRIESGDHACWLACSCGAVGPRRAGDPDSAWTAADDDRARHLAGQPTDLTFDLHSEVPSAKELLHA